MPTKNVFFIIEGKKILLKVKRIGFEFSLVADLSFYLFVSFLDLAENPKKRSQSTCIGALTSSANYKALKTAGAFLGILQATPTLIR